MHTGPARGMRDFLPEDVRRRQYVIDIVRGVYERYGFEPLETPALENIETLTGKYGEEGDKLLYKVLRRGEGEASGQADLALRYDLTVPLARVVADNRGTLPKFFKRYQIQPVWRADRPQRGRFREFYQCDVDAIGSTSPVVEAEMIAAVSEVLQALGFTEFTVQLNHRALLTAMLEAAGVPAAKHGDALIAIDKLDKVGRDKVAEDLIARGIEPRSAEVCLAAFEDHGAFERLVSEREAGRAASENIAAIRTLIDSTPAKGHVSFTPRLARGLSYYTGAIMEIAVPDLAGSLGGGGRYDGLIGMFSGEQIPACGFSLGLERILVVMTERGMFPPDVQASGPDVLVTIFETALASESLTLARELRAAGLRVEVYPDALRGGKDLGKAFKYADARRARCVTVMGQDEASRGEVKIKTLSTGEQASLPRAEVASHVRRPTSNLQPPTSSLNAMTVEPLGHLARTHTCGELHLAHVGQDVVLLGWVHRVRDLGGVMFFDIRDRHGITQAVVRDASLEEKAKRLRPEFVVGILGRVDARAPDAINPKLKTGEIEIAAREIRLLNDAKTPPFPINEDTAVSEEMRLRYRYLDLRRPKLQQNMILRHKAAFAVRKYFDEHGFLEIETPILNKSTPEGARDYLVPSRVHPGEFYALPQSPQIFKQILMISGLDRYFQIAKCFRDEDLRADRQPEFTQVDLEISFATEDLVFSILEPLMGRLMALVGRDAPPFFRRMPYAEAIAKYGSDKPDLRPGMELQALSDVFAASSFSVFRGAIDAGGEVRGFVIPGAARYSRKELDNLIDEAKGLGAAGLVWARHAEGTLQSPALKAAGDDAIRRALTMAGAGAGDLLVMAAGPHAATARMLGQLRLNVAKRENRLDPDRYEFLWVVDFPMFEWLADEQRWEFMHHPFTAPLESDASRLESDPGSVRARAYDMVLNGSEIGGGSIRIHDQRLQRLVFKLLGMSDQEAKARFGFFVDALEFGTPPHGGIALGLDRICAILAGETSIREVIAFPKTAQAVDLMSGAPSTVDPRQLRELHIRTE